MSGDLATFDRYPSVAAAKVAMRRLDGHVHMRGWEAFGTEHDEPEVRRLGTVTFTRSGGIAIREHDDAEDWPPSELYNGVAAISIGSYGDHPAGAYIAVVGPDRDAVEAAWRRARSVFLAAADTLWTAEP